MIPDTDMPVSQLLQELLQIVVEQTRLTAFMNVLCCAAQTAHALAHAVGHAVRPSFTAAQLVACLGQVVC